MIRHDCRVCSRPLGTVVLDLGARPLANAYTARPGGPEARYPLRVAVCEGCGAAQLFDHVDPQAMFGGDYAYHSSVNAPYVRQCHQLADELVDGLGLGRDDLVVEIGSNDGYLLSRYVERRVGVLGFEPADNLAMIAKAAGVATVRDFFRPASGVSIAGKARVVHANNVLAHAPDIIGILDGVATALAPDGLLIVETPHLSPMVANRLYDTCLPPSELIVTEDGLRPIGEVQPGERVLSHTGHWRRVLRVSRRHYSGSLRVVSAWGQQSAPVRMTPEHPLWIERAASQRRRRHEEYRVAYGTRGAVTAPFVPEFVAASDVVKGDLWLTPLIREENAPSHLEVSTVTPGRHGQMVTSRFPVDRNLMVVAGFYLAEGSYVPSGRNKRSHRVQFTFGLSDAERTLAEECVGALMALGASASSVLTQFGWRVQTNGPIAALLNEQFGRYSYGKSLPGWAFSLPSKLTEALIDAYARGDGYQYRDGQYLRVSTVSMALAQGVALLAAKLGWASSVSTGKPGRPKTIAANPKPTMNPRPLIDLLIRVTPKARQKHWIEGDWHSRRVASVYEEDYSGDVCNLEVETDNSYCTPAGAVHNCYHEHVFYWSALAFDRACRRVGLAVVRVQRLETHGGSVRMFVARQGARGADESTVAAFADEQRRGMTGPAYFDGFQEAAEYHRDELRERILKWAAEGRVAAYGAAAKGTILLDWLGLPAGTIEYVVDATPYKVGLHMPGSGIPIVSPDRFDADPPDVTVVLSWNWADAIAANHPDYRGRWELPHRPLAGTTRPLT